MSELTATDAAAAVIVAYFDKHGSGISSDVAALLVAQILGEGSLTRYFRGTNNLGAMHATQGFARAHASDAGYGMVAFLDHGPGGGAYIARMAVFPTPADGARAFLDTVERMVPLESVSSSHDYAQALYLHGYYTGFAAPVTPLADRAAAAAQGALLPADQQNIDAYARLIASHLTEAKDAVSHAADSDPHARSSTPDFAPLADRLTPAPSYAPHTIDHARELLGDSADHPPAGAVSLADALATPGGEGVWMFGTGSSSSSSTPATSSDGVSAGALIATTLGVALLFGVGAWMLRARVPVPAAA